MPRKVFYTKHMINDDGSIAVMDATDEIIRIKRELKRPKDANGTMSVEEVVTLRKYNLKQLETKYIQASLLKVYTIRDYRRKK